VAANLLRYFPASGPAMLAFLAAHGPRESDLWLRFKHVYREDVCRLGVDVLARMGEFETTLPG
jgi:hypothetical protein